jgi:hypothetical protein
VKYLIYRWILAAYYFFVLILSIVEAAKCKQAKFYAIYLTNWNVMLNAFSSLFGAVLITLYYRRVIKFEGTQRMPTAFKIYWAFSIFSVVVSTTISSIYWPLIYNGRDKGLNDSLTHAGNAIIMIIDVFINAHPPRFFQFIYPLGFGVFYGYIFATIYTFSGGTDRDYNNYIYSVLDYKNNTSSAFIFAGATTVALIIVHLIITCFAWIRVMIHRKLVGKTVEITKAGDENL